MWFIFGFSLTLGPDTAGLVGNLDWTFLKGVPFNDSLANYAPTIPGVLFAKFEMMFAVITPLLLTGAIAERMKFSAFIIFIARREFSNILSISTLDLGWRMAGQTRGCGFCWGIVIHTSAGMGALAPRL